LGVAADAVLGAEEADQVEVVRSGEVICGMPEARGDRGGVTDQPYSLASQQVTTVTEDD
jgi:hypothetical protein